MSAILAKILNSTVGTSSLKALDTILKTDNTTIANNAADRLFNSLKNSAKLVGSDDVMFNYTGTWSRGYGDKLPDYGFGENDYLYVADSFIQFDTSGTVIIKTQQTHGSTSDQTYYLIVVDANKNKIGEAREDVDSYANFELSYALNVTKGTKYKIVLVNDNGGYLTGNFEVCGKTMLLGATVTVTT